jgi:hypothetical protein
MKAGGGNGHGPAAALCGACGWRKPFDGVGCPGQARTALTAATALWRAQGLHTAILLLGPPAAALPALAGRHHCMLTPGGRGALCFSRRPIPAPAQRASRQRRTGKLHIDHLPAVVRRIVPVNRWPAVPLCQGTSSLPMLASRSNSPVIGAPITTSQLLEHSGWGRRPGLTKCYRASGAHQRQPKRCLTLLAP